MYVCGCVRVFCVRYIHTHTRTHTHVHAHIPAHMASMCTKEALSVITVKADRKSFFTAVSTCCFSAHQNNERYPPCVPRSVHSHKELSLKASEAGGPSSHSFSQAFVQTLTQLKLGCYFNCLCNSASFQPIDSLLSVTSLCPQGCYSAVVDYFELYIYVAGALAIVVLTIEVRASFKICNLFFFFLPPVYSEYSFQKICKVALTQGYLPEYASVMLFEQQHRHLVLKFSITEHSGF